MRTNLLILLLPLFLSACSTLPVGTQPVQTFGISLSNGEPVVEVLVRGQVLRLSIDTGAESEEVAIVPATIRKLGLTPLGTSEQTLDMEGNTHNNVEYSIEKLTIGGTEFTNVAVSEENRDRVLGDGIIGNKLLSRFKVLIDYRTARMAFLTGDQASGLLKSGAFEALRFNQVPAGLQVSIPIGGKSKIFLLDTGASVIDGDRVYGVVRRTSGGAKNLYTSDLGPQDLVTVDPAVLNGKAVGPLTFVQVDLPEAFPADGLVGYCFFKDRQVLLDFQAGIISWRTAP